MKRHSDADGNSWTWIGIWLGIAIAVSGCASAKKTPSASYGLSGYEIFLGQRNGSRTTGALFSGWTNESKSAWQGDSNPNSFWAVSANYTGNPGIGGSANLTGGKWFLTTGDTVTTGTISGGSIAWPSSLTSELSGRTCGQGIGHVNVEVVTSEGRPGRMTGCLDDTHVHLGTFPPKVWGTLTFP